MRKLAGVCCVVAVIAASNAVSGAEYYRGPLFPTPVPQATPFVGLDHHEHAVEMAPRPPAAAKKVTPIRLYDCVKVEDPDHIAPCAVPILVEMIDPCWKPGCGCCKPKCVYIQICVPRQTPCHQHCAPSCAAPGHHHACHGCNKCHCCGCEHKPLKITCSKDGRYKKYDYGKYRVEIRVKRNGWIEVDYDD